MIALQIENRQRLYYRQYEYAIKLAYSGFRYLKNLDENAVLHEYNRGQIFHWRDVDRHRSSTLLSIAEDLQYCESQTNNFKKITSWTNQYYYTNDPLFVTHLSKVSEISVVSYTKAVPSLPDNVLLRKNAKFQYRSYFREKRIDPEKAQEFLKFVSTRNDYFKIHADTRYRIELGRTKYPFRAGSFIEHNSLLDLTLIEMVLPGYISRTLPIQTK